jgi:hypothetical protein
VHTANYNLAFFPDADLLAVTELLDLPALVPDVPGDDHDPSVYVGTYLIDNGNTTRVSLRDDGTLRLSSPSCDLEAIASGNFRCDASAAWFTFDANGEVKYLVVTDHWVATPDPGDGQ